MESRFDDLAKTKTQDKKEIIHAVTNAVTQVLTSSLPQLITEQLKVAIASNDGEDI